VLALGTTTDVEDDEAVVRTVDPRPAGAERLVIRHDLRVSSVDEVAQAVGGSTHARVRGEQVEDLGGSEGGACPPSGQVLSGSDDDGGLVVEQPIDEIADCQYSDAGPLEMRFRSAPPWDEMRQRYHRRRRQALWRSRHRRGLAVSPRPRLKRLDRTVALPTSAKTWAERRGRWRDYLGRRGSGHAGVDLGHRRSIDSR